MDLLSSKTICVKCFLLLIVISTSGFIKIYTEATVCYACDISTSKACQTDSATILAVNDLITRSWRNCTGSYAYCVIESITNAEGVSVAFRRSCSDGQTFSYKLKDVPLLAQVQPNNKTVCAYYNGQTICLALCDTDFCNGPLDIKRTNSAGVWRPSTTTSLLVIILLSVFLF